MAASTSASSPSARPRRAGPTQLWLVVVVAVIGSALMLVMSDAALGARSGNVVPANGKVAGHGYGYWLKRSWQATFGAIPPADPCRSLTSNRRRVGYLTLTTLAPRTDKYTCREPAGRPLYVVELSNECSTFKADHANYGTSGRQLMRCARALFAGAQVTTALDGDPVNVAGSIAATAAYRVDSPENNPFGVPAGMGRSAAYGFGLLLTGFARGTHTIHSQWSIGTSHWDVTFTVRVERNGN